jgi:geranylgeranyl diphosphate synthase type II
MILVDSTAAALELIHCASLVHDDLACFDNAEFRRGKPAVHVEFGEQMAVLTGDALIVMAFKTLLAGAAEYREQSTVLLNRLVHATKSNGGVIAGQAWEFEENLDLKRYHRAKTGALFAAAAACGALSAGSDPAPWEHLGAALGEAYQLADDIADVVSDTEATGKPSGQDALLGRPNVAMKIGIAEATNCLRQQLETAYSLIPRCRHAVEFQEWLAATTKRIMANRWISVG